MCHVYDCAILDEVADLIALSNPPFDASSVLSQPGHAPVLWLRGMALWDSTYVALLFLMTATILDTSSRAEHATRDLRDALADFNLPRPDPSDHGSDEETEEYSLEVEGLNQ